MFATPLVVAAGAKDDDDPRNQNEQSTRATAKKASLVGRRSVGENDDDDDDDALPFFLNHREEKTSPEEHESAAILFELMSSSHPRGGRGGAFFRGATKNAVAALGKADVKNNNNNNVNTTSVDNNDRDKNGQRKRKKSANAETPATTTKTKRRLSAKFNTAAVGEEKIAATRKDGEGLDFTTCAAETEKKGKKGKKYRAAKKEETTVSMKHHQQQQSSAFIGLSDFIMKRLEADASVPKSWVAFARAMARGEDEAVREASMCFDDTEEEFKIRRKSTATRTSSKKTKNNEDDEDEDDDEDDDENEAGAEDQDGVFIDAACRRARYLKGVTKLSADLIRRNPSAAWLECIAADAHDRARQIRRTKKKCEKNRKQSVASMYRACGLNGNNNNNNNNQKEMVEDVSTIALANVYANWELGLAKEMELYCNQLENVELISAKAKADCRASSAEENIFSMEQLERSNNCEHEKAKQFVTELRTHSEKVAALWRYNAKGRNAF